MARPTFWRAALFGATLGLLVILVGGLAWVLGEATSWLRRAELYAGSLASVALLVGRPHIDALARRIGGEMGPAAAWGGMTWGAAALAFALAMRLDDVFTSPFSFMRGFTVFWELDFEALLVPVVTTVAATAWVFRRSGPVAGAGSRAVRRTAWVVLALAGSLVVSAGVRAARAPTLAHYVDSLPLVGKGRDLTDVAARLGEAPKDGMSQHHEDDAVGPLVLRRYLFQRNESVCESRLAREADRLPARVARSWGRTDVGCGAVALWHDSPHEAYFARATDSDTYGVVTASFDARTLEPLEPSQALNRTFADAMSAPWSWVLASAAMALFALGALAAPSRSARWLALREHWRAGHATDEGRIVFDDGGAARLVPLGVEVPVGPVVVLDRPSEAMGGAAPFRDAGGWQGALQAESVMPGTVASVMARLRGDVAAGEAYALAAAAMASAPLVAAASVGLVV